MDADLKFDCAAMSDKLCLKWNDFQENINSAFGRLRKDNNFSDVTLACADGQQLEAHKVILAASSPMFQNLLSRNKHPNPMIYVRGIRSEDLVAMLDFLYYGEANVYQDNLESFLALAEEFQLKGLMQGNEEVKRENQTQAKAKERSSDDGLYQTSNDSVKQPGNALAIPDDIYGGELQDWDERVRSMMEKSQNLISNGKQKAFTCKICGKEGHGTHIKNHIVANHLEGVSIPCNYCGKTFRSRIAVRRHKLLQHHT